jgi:hypothetical protein
LVPTNGTRIQRKKRKENMALCSQTKTDHFFFFSFSFVFFAPLILKICWLSAGEAEWREAGCTVKKSRIGTVPSQSFCFLSHSFFLIFNFLAVLLPFIIREVASEKLG